MADEKTFTETEHIAILADRVASETASLTQANTVLTTEQADLQNKLDVAESAKVAAEQRAEKAEKDFAEFKTGLDELATQGAKKDERIAAVKEVAAHLGDAFLDEADEVGKSRVARIVAMDDDSFVGYVADLKATVPAGSTVVTPPREAALLGTPSTAAGGAGTGPTAAQQVLLGRYRAPAQKEA